VNSNTLRDLDLSEFELDPLRGILYKNGKKCGSKGSQGYYMMRIGRGRVARVHRVIYMFVFGDIPDNCVIDHINNNRFDNRPWNLQAITNRENITKDKRPKSKFHNIYLTKNNKYSVQVKDKGSQRRFKTLEEAIKYRDFLLSL
jgi:hypothetical protein